MIVFFIIPPLGLFHVFHANSSSLFPYVLRTYEAAADSSRQKSSHHQKVLSPRLFKPRRRSNANCRLMRPRKTNTAFHEDVARAGGGPQGWGRPASRRRRRCTSATRTERTKCFTPSSRGRLIAPVEIVSLFLPFHLSPFTILPFVFMSTLLTFLFFFLDARFTGGLLRFN